MPQQLLPPPELVTIDVARDAPHKYEARIRWPGGRSKVVQFGRVSDSGDPDNDYPHHRSQQRMLAYLKRHGARDSLLLQSLQERGEPTTESAARAIEEAAARHVTASRKEDWSSASGVGTPGFWARWFLWSFRDIDDVLDLIAHLTSTEELRITAAAERRFGRPCRSRT